MPLEDNWFCSLLWTKNISNKHCGENQNTHFMLNNFFFWNCIMFGMMGKNVVQQGRSQMTVWHMLVACWIPKATNTHSDFIIFIAFYSNNGCTNAPQFYVICTLLVLLLYSTVHYFHHIVILRYSSMRNESYKYSIHQPLVLSHLSSFIVYLSLSLETSFAV
jgi:hypothetical protein